MSKGQRAKAHNPAGDQLLARIESLDARVKQSRDDLESASQLETLGLLTGAIAHEFNNILTPILSYARVALDSPEDIELCKHALERAAMGVERASRIASSVLRLAGRDSSTLAHEHCSPTHALEGALSCLAEPLESLCIELRTDLPKDLSLAIPQTDLEHVLLNLLLNSVRALRERGGVIEIAADTSGADAARSTWNSSTGTPVMARLTFRDNGPGIDEQTRPALFAPFQRHDTAAPGHGLGLTICRQLVDAVGGTIAVEPDTGSGALFTIILPIAKPHDAAA